MPIEFLFLFCMRAVNIGPYIEFILITDMLVSRFYCNSTAFRFQVAITSM